MYYIAGCLENMKNNYKINEKNKIKNRDRGIITMVFRLDGHMLDTIFGLISCMIYSCSLICKYDAHIERGFIPVEFQHEYTLLHTHTQNNTCTGNARDSAFIGRMVGIYAYILYNIIMCIYNTS